MDLQVTSFLNSQHVRRSAASSTIFLNRIVLFGGIPHEDDVDVKDTPKPILDLKEAFLLDDNDDDDDDDHDKKCIKFGNDEEEEFSSSISTSIDSSNILKREQKLRTEYFKSLRLLQNSEKNKQEQQPNNSDVNDELFNILQNSQQLALCDQGTFPPIASRSPLFVFLKNKRTDNLKIKIEEPEFAWKFISSTYLQPWSRHGHFLVVDPFHPNKLRILGGRHWHIGDEFPEKDLIFEVSPDFQSAKWQEENPPTGFPQSLFSAAVAFPRRQKKGNGKENDSSSIVTLAYTFGGMLANRTITDAVYKIEVQNNSSISNNCNSSLWKATKISSACIGSSPEPQFKGIISLVYASDEDEENNSHQEPSHLITFDGFVGKTNVPPNVYELDLQTQVWRHVCMSTPVARGVGLNFCRGRYLAIHGGHRTADPVRRLGSFVVFDFKLQKWVGTSTGKNSNRREMVIQMSKNSKRENKILGQVKDRLQSEITNPRSAHCGLVLNRQDDEEAFKYYVDINEKSLDVVSVEDEVFVILCGSEERTKFEEDDGMLVISVVNDGEDPIEYELLLHAENDDNHNNNNVNSDRQIRVPAPEALIRQYQEMLKRSGDTGNGGEPVGSVIFGEFSRKINHPRLLEVCAEFLAEEKDDLLEDFF